MRRPRFALSVMLGAMAVSLAALGLPPCANSPASGRDTPNAALICPTSSLAAESHPFRWFETADEGFQADVIDGWVRTVQVPQNPPLPMRLETCDLSIAFRERAESAATQLALELCGLGWTRQLGACPDFRFAGPRRAASITADASALANDYRHSTGQAEVLRINLREGRSRGSSARFLPGNSLMLRAAGTPITAFPDDVSLGSTAYASDHYQRYYRGQRSADAAAAWLGMLTRQLTSGLSEAIAQSVPVAKSTQAPIHTISIVRRQDAPTRSGNFELVSDDGTRFVYLRSEPSPADWLAGDDANDTASDPFEPVIDGPDRFLYLRTDGAQAPPLDRVRSMAVMLPRPFPPGAAIGIDADWLAWDYFTFQVTDGIEPDRCDSAEAGVSGPDVWDCVAWARRQDTPREQIEAEEAASDGASDAAQGLIEAQSEAEGVAGSAVPDNDLSNPLHLPHTPPGCHGSDTIGCLDLRAQMRAERWATSAAWSLTRLAAILEECASRLRDVAASPVTEIEPEQPEPADSTRASGWLESIEHTTASQRFLSELYLGL